MGSSRSASRRGGRGATGPGRRAFRPGIPAEGLEGRRLLAAFITVFPIPTANGDPQGITAGPDGNLWFTETAANQIGRITPEGDVTEFPLPTPSVGGGPLEITAGPDGNLWFTRSTQVGSNTIDRITTAGAITEFALPPGRRPSGITAGPDGNLWFTESGGGKIGRITPAGAITEFPLPTANTDPVGITAGPDGNLWFTELGGSKIGRITPAGVLTEFALPTSERGPAGITAGPDGNLWFTVGSVGDQKVGRITPAGDATEFPVNGAFPSGITLGPDQALWFIESLDGKIGRITPSGSLTEFRLPNFTAFPIDITAGPDGNLWFTELGAGAIGRLVPGASVSAAGIVVNATAGAPFSGVVATATDARFLATAGDLSATIDWGDGSPEVAGTVEAAGSGGFQVIGGHTYGRAGTFTITVTIKDAVLGMATATGTANVAPTVAGPPAVAGFLRLGIHRQPTRLALAFSAPLDPAAAQDPNHYLLAAPGRDRRFGTRDDRMIRIDSAAYDPATNTVTLSPNRRLDRHRPFQLTLRGMTGVDGAPLAGATTFRFGLGAVPPALDRLFGPVGTVGVPAPIGPAPTARAAGHRASPSVRRAVAGGI
jgi:streptogramin lyase